MVVLCFLAYILLAPVKKILSSDPACIIILISAEMDKEKIKVEQRQM